MATREIEQLYKPINIWTSPEGSDSEFGFSKQESVEASKSALCSTSTCSAATTVYS